MIHLYLIVLAASHAGQLVAERFLRISNARVKRTLCLCFELVIIITYLLAGYILLASNGSVA